MLLDFAKETVPLSEGNKIDHDQYYYITYFGIIQHFCKLFTKCLQLLSDIDTSKNESRYK